MAEVVKSLSDEVDYKVKVITETFPFFRGPLVYVDYDCSMTPIDYNNDFNLFKAVFYENFEDSLKKINALKSFRNNIHNLGYRYVMTSEDDFDKEYCFHWQYLVGIGDDPDNLCYNNFECFFTFVLDDDNEKIDQFCVDCKRITESTLDGLKEKFEKFSACVLRNLAISDTEEIEGQGQGDEDLHYDKIFNQVKFYLNGGNAISQKRRIFESEDDLNEACKIISNFFLKRDGVSAKKPLNIILDRKTKFGSILGLLRVRLSTDQGILKDDLNYLGFVKKNFLTFSTYTDAELVNSLQKSHYT